MSVGVDKSFLLNLNRGRLRSLPNMFGDIETDKYPVTVMPSQQQSDIASGQSRRHDIRRRQLYTIFILSSCRTTAMRTVPNIKSNVEAFFLIAKQAQFKRMIRID